MYVNFNENPRGNYYAGDCVIRAINIVTGISWDEIYTTLCAEGFYLGDWGNTNASWDWYLRSLGSYARGYSRDDAKEDFIEEIEELMEKAPDMETRQKFERFISKMR